MSFLCDFESRANICYNPDHLPGLSPLSPDQNQTIAREITQAGLERLEPLFDSGKEAELLTQSYRWAQGGTKPDGLESQYGLILSIHPPIGLTSINCLAGDIVVATAVAKKLARIHYRLAETTGQVWFIGISGTARRFASTGPPATQRSLTPLLAHEPRRYYNEDTPPRPQDADILFLSTPPKTLEWLSKCFTGHMDLEDPLHFPRDLVNLKTSTRRPHFTRLEINSLDKTLEGHRLGKHIPLAQIAPPGIFGYYGPELRLLHYVLTHSDTPPPVVLVPIYHGHTKLTDHFEGVAIDFFPDRKYYTKVTFRQRGQDDILYQRQLTPATYPCPDLAFPEVYGHFTDALDYFLHELRTWPWNDQLPLFPRYYTEDSIVSVAIPTVDTPKSRQIIKELSRDTALWFRDYIVKGVGDKPHAVDTPRQQQATSQQIFETLPKAFNGDPLLTLIRCLDYSQDPLRPDLPVFGMDIFQSWLHSLHDFLQKNDRIPRLLSVMEKCPAGVTQKGWKVFIDFLTQECRGDTDRVQSLLTTIWGHHPSSLTVPPST